VSGVAPPYNPYDSSIVTRRDHPGAFPDHRYTDVIPGIPVPIMPIYSSLEELDMDNFTSASPNDNASLANSLATMTSFAGMIDNEIYSGSP